MLNIIIWIILIIVGIVLAPYIIAIGLVVGLIYLAITNLDKIFLFLGKGIGWIISNLHIIIGIIIAIVIIGIIMEKYDSTIGKDKKLKLRRDILEVLNKLGMADCNQISKVLTENEVRVQEELKVLVSLGKVCAEKMNSGDRNGEYIYKSLGAGNTGEYTNYEYEEIKLD